MKIKFKIVMLISFFLFACGKSQSPMKTAKSYEIKPQILHKRLYFTGIIKPWRESSLNSPMDAVVETMNFHYGALVKKNDLIFKLNSNQLQKQYNEVLTDYLKAKDSYTIALAKFTGTSKLWKAGLVAKNNYLSEKSSLDTLRVSLMQASEKLSDLLGSVDAKRLQEVSSLHLSDFSKIKKLLNANHHSIFLRANADGILLYPPKSENKSNLSGIGQAVKSGQVLALIGDLRGVSVEIDVPEVDIDKIHPGMEALISGIAFGGHQLKGQLVSINAQASSSNAASLPTFTALIQVKALSPEEQRFIKVGMSATIELPIDTANQLLIPIKAVKHDDGKTFVNLQLAEGSSQQRLIRTGISEHDRVVIESGLRAGDVVLYDE